MTLRTAVDRTLRHWPEQIAADVRHSLRALGKAPLFTSVALLSLALGIGANTAIFSIVYAVMLKSLPVQDPERLVQVSVGERQTSLTNPIWEQIRDRQQVFDGALAYAGQRFNLATGGEKQTVGGLFVSGDYFQTLGIPAFAGRTITRDDDRRGGGVHGAVAVLSYAYWRDTYDASPAALGTTIRLDGHPFTIVGVSPPGFSGVTVGNRFDVAVPFATLDQIRGTKALDQRTSWYIHVLGRLKPGMTREQAQAGLRALGPQIREATRPTTLYVKADVSRYLADPFTLLPAANGPSYLRQQYGTALLTLMGIVALVLLIACANLANLLLARASARQKEFAVRLALGATRPRLVRQLLTESLLLALGGSVLGLLLAQWSSRLIVRQLSTYRSALFVDLSVDGSLLAFTIGVAMLTTMIFGLAPAFRSTDLSANALLKGSARSVAAGWRGFSVEKLLVVGQIALSLVLVFGAAIFVRSFASLATLDPGFDSRQVLFVNVDTRRTDVPEERRAVEYQRMLDTLRAVPGIRAAAITNTVPISGNSWTETVHVRGLESLSDRQRGVHMNSVSPGYFATLGTPFYAGRDFTAQDAPATPRVAIVNETFARRFFNGANPIGQTFEQPAPNDTRTRLSIIGLVKDSKYVNMRIDVPPTVYVAAAQEREPGGSPTFVIRGSGDVTALTRSIAAAMRDVNPGLALEFGVMDTLIHQSLRQERLIAMLSGFFGTLALLVAGIGLYGVMSLAVSRRRQEIGIRMALGAEPSSVVRMVLRDVAIVTAIGLTIGAVSGLMSGRFVRTLLFGLEPNDLTTWLLAIAALAAAAALAGWLPARRAAKLDPMLALREE